MSGVPAEISRVGIVGCGVMGSGIAEACARRDLDVVVVGPGAESVERGRRRLVDSLDRALRKSRISEAERDAVLGRARFTADLQELADRELVLEAIPEDEPAKLAMFGDIDKIVAAPEAVLGSNTSSIPIVRLARATQRPEQVIGIHFFSPAAIQPLVEVVPSLLTSTRAGERVESFLVDRLGKQPIRSPDRAGFVVNALLIPYLLAAIRMVESGFAPAETVDRGMVLGCSHPVGPLKLVDLIGLDTIAAVAQSLYQEFREPQYAPPPLLRRMVEGGLYGKKSGQGFYTYPLA
ncbi:3-hydroxybutyryl-CoA dehydrogenase [Phytohabitans suffuscus]|uniref:3-hydroxybutyryl-CoA dehydrogenase n=1 Tax=Phytohabitans suffuscus TaxID=624315 RepID=A0A6F8Y9G0_9ACTN|nr:3-hydroxybutyryl-CoA dehydrogenase [Phytohabitans suffuscus]BCB82707.1 3-hydroxybutyryl-CoA dehydrogenase [Phytohabitans suffuscus]